MDKDRVRERIWDRLSEAGVTRFPFPIEGRIPNFQGAERAATRLAQLPAWRRARVLKANPDSPQRPVREAALRAGMTVYMAVPRLRHRKCFVELRSKRVGDPRKASTIRGAFDAGTPVEPEEVRKVDLVVTGSVAVDREGGRVGKGGGYSDLEYALGRAFGFVTEETPVITTVHPLQVVETSLPMTDHDVPLDFVVTPHGTIETSPAHERPSGVQWDLLSQEKRARIPVLEELWETKEAGP